MDDADPELEIGAESVYDYLRRQDADLLTDKAIYTKSLTGPILGLVFPAYGFMNEEAYNKHVADSIDDFALMDRKLISIGAGTSKVEFCDLYSKNGHIVHVKKYGGSSVLSHLFNQGVVSAECFIRDSVFRVKLNGHLPDDFKFEAPEETPDAKAYEVCYAIMSDKPGALELPFFSKVALKHASVRVRMLGFRVTKLKIEQV